MGGFCGWVEIDRFRVKTASCGGRKGHKLN